MKNIFISFLIFILSNLCFAGKIDLLIEHMKDEISFEENNYFTLSNDQKFIVQRAKRDSKTYETFAEQIEKAKKLLSSLEKYKKDGLYPNVLLSKVFYHRIEMIHKSIKDFMVDSKLVSRFEIQPQNVCYKIDNESLNEVKKYSSSDALWTFIITKTSLDRFQLYSFIIKELLWDIKNKGLSLTEENTVWLRCSRTLHPLLRGQIELIEKPENAFGLSVSDDYDRTYETELILFDHYLYKRLFGKERLCSLGTKDSLLKSSEAILVQRWITGEELLQLPASEINIIPENLRRKSNPLIPVFSFPEDLKDFKTEEIILPPKALEEPCFEQINCNNDELNKIKKNDDNINIEPEIFNDITSEEGDYEKILKNEHQKFQEQKKQLHNFNIDELAVQIDDIEDRLMNLKSNDILFLKNLFDGKLKTLQYRQFFSIWTSLCGLKSIIPSKKGSSHFSLLNFKGAIIGGIFTHGMGQEYWGKAVADIKKHFIAIGITKKYLLKL